MLTDFDIERLKKIFIEKGKKLSQLVVGVITWANITGKPSVFPPEGHTHTSSDITDLNEGLVGTKEVDETSIADERILEYDTTSGKLIYVDKPTGGGGGYFNKLDGTTAPTVNDDSADGFEVGSLWLDITNSKVYQCLDATTGAAVWIDLTNTGSGSLPTTATDNLILVSDSLAAEGSSWKNWWDAFVTDYSSIVQSISNLISYWRFNEASGTALDEEVAGNDATTTNPTGRSYQGAIYGDDNKSFYFGGSTSNYVNLGQPASLEFTPDVDEYSVSLWVLTSFAGTYSVISRADPSASRHFYIYCGSDKKFSVHHGGAATAGSIMPTVAPFKWSHVCFVNKNNGGTLQYTLYIDGVADPNLTNINSGSTTQAIDWLIGARRSSGNTGIAIALVGQVDEVAIYNKALSSLEVEKLSAPGRGRGF